MSAEAWRRRGTHGRRGLLRDRRDTFSTSDSIYVEGMKFSLPPQMSAEAWRRRETHGRRGLGFDESTLNYYMLLRDSKRTLGLKQRGHPMVWCAPKALGEEPAN